MADAVLEKTVPGVEALQIEMEEDMREDMLSRGYTEASLPRRRGQVMSKPL